jgi:serine/threonine protein kinase
MTSVRHAEPGPVPYSECLSMSNPSDVKHDPAHAERLLKEFDQAWRAGTAPRIEDFLRRGGNANRKELLEELIAIDLGYRWRQANGSERLVVEDYLRRFPELGSQAQVSLDLIREEYWVRHRWGDKPSNDVYFSRFGKRGGTLEQTLARAYAELVQEYHRDGRSSQRALRPVPPAGPAAAEPPAKPVDLAAFVAGICQTDLLSPAQRTELQRLQTRMPDARSLARELLRRHWLTPYQVNQAMIGRAADLLVGAYVLLERLGEGGAGQVFKARHRQLNRVVALKILRKELVTDAESVARFYREFEIVSRLDHVNVVRAFEAGPTGTAHIIAMQFVEGTDLGRMVKKCGPLPVWQATEYIRQAALGLQYAHEQGLVHRDIKPHNLLLEPKTSLIKVADLGLARLPRPVNDEVTAALTNANPSGAGTLTPQDAGLMGTVDYMAPEQAVDFHNTDIRADIYSLGCTFYFLLTGQPPFAGGPLTHKLLRHQNAEPPPLEQFRKDVPPHVAAVLHTMLAKRAQDRYQTPAAVVAALGSIPGKASRILGIIFRRRRQLRIALLTTGLASLLFLGVVWGAWKAFHPAEKTESTGVVSGPTAPPPPREYLHTVKIVQGRPMVRDVLLDPARPDTRLGSVPRDNPIIKQEQRVATFLVHFDLAALTLPASTQVEKATLSFYVWDPSSAGNTKVCAFGMKTPWEEASASWRQPAERKKWKNGNHFAVGTDTFAASPPTIVLPDKGTDTVDPPLEYQLDVTELAKAWLSGQIENHGLAIVPVPDQGVDRGLGTRFQVYGSEHERTKYTPKLTLAIRYY